MGGISFSHRTPLIAMDGMVLTLHSSLRTTVDLFFAAHLYVTLFERDNVRPHSAYLTIAFLRQRDINMLSCPAFSSDLSQIEHLWDCRAVRKRNMQPHTRRQLHAALLEEGRATPQVRTQCLIHSI